jgi:hypothetical protein
MTLIKVLHTDDEKPNDPLLWNYYENTGLMAYCKGNIGKSHSRIEETVVDNYGDQGDNIFDGMIMNRIRKAPSHILATFYESSLTAKQRQDLIDFLKRIAADEVESPVKLKFGGMDEYWLEEL